MYLKRQRITN